MLMSRLTSSTFVLSSVGFALVLASACGNKSDQGTSSVGGTGTNATGTGGPSSGGTASGVTGDSGVTGSTTGVTGATASGDGAGTTASSGGTSSGGATTVGDMTTTSGTPNGGATSGMGGGGGASTSSGGAGTGGSSGGGDTVIPGTDNYDCSGPEGDVPPLMLTEVASGMTAPVDVTHPPNDDRLFVITLDGDVRIIKDGQLVATPFLSLGNQVTAGGNPGDERGLLGIAFHPDYASNGLFYLHYSAGSGVAGTSAGDTVIEEFKVSSDPDVADAASGRVVLTVEQPNNGTGFYNHKGGSINFGSDGMLYIGLGDGGGSGDSHGNSGSGFAQNTSMLLGKILRINPVESGGQPYSTPADNLVQDVSGAAPEIWDYGLRNPFRRSFDACTGDMYIGDVGQDTWEEINVERVGEGRKNYGWNVWEAQHCFPPSTQSCDETGITMPLVELDRQSAQSITGGSVYRGSSIPSMRGAYIYADYVSNGVWYTWYDRAAGTVDTPKSLTQELNVNNIVAIKNGNDGELYFVAVVAMGEISSNLGQGAVYRLEASQ